MSNEEQRYLKNRNNKRVFLRTDGLAVNSDYSECDINGKYLSGHVADAKDEDKPTIEKAKYIGRVQNGRLFPWTDQLSLRDDVIAINSREHWAVYLAELAEAVANGAPIPPDVTLDDIVKYAEAASLAVNIDTATGGKPDEAKGDIDPPESDKIDLLVPPAFPANTPAAESKQIMIDWATAKFPDTPLSPDLSVKNMLEACTQMADEYNNQLLTEEAAA